MAQSQVQYENSCWWLQAHSLRDLVVQNFAEDQSSEANIEINNHIFAQK